MGVLLEIKDLVKKYGRFTAVDGISLSIRQGICFGLLGPNGAGKTTALEMIEDIMPATSGQVYYKGKPRDARFREEIGIQFQRTDLLAFLKVGETLGVFQRLYQETDTVEELVELCKITEILGAYNDKISGGQRQRLLLALALVNKPELLFLDEPSTGLDPQARRNLWEIIQRVKEQGKTIVLTTHSMEEAQNLCDEIAIMDHGKIIARGSPKDLIREYCSGVTVLLPRENVKTPPVGLPFDVKATNDHLEIQTADINACLKKLMAMDIDLSDMIVRSPNLEDVFLFLTGRQLRD